jgi:hypothetical protein
MIYIPVDNPAVERVSERSLTPERVNTVYHSSEPVKT